MKLNEKIEKILNENDFLFGNPEKGYNTPKYYLEFGKYTSFGEDWSEVIWFDGTFENFANELSELAYNFDIDEAVEIRIPNRGKVGCPSSISELIDDAKWKKKELEKLSYIFLHANEKEEYTAKNKMKYLVCKLDDQNYTYPTFQIYDTEETAFLETVKDISNLFITEKGKVEITHQKEKIRIDWSCDDRFYVIEIIPYEITGNYLLVWHHAYNGVNFEILAQTTDYQECVEERIRRISKIFEEEDLSNGDNEDFDIKHDTCIDTGEEWEMFDIILNRSDNENL